MTFDQIRAEIKSVIKRRHQRYSVPPWETTQDHDDLEQFCVRRWLRLPEEEKSKVSVETLVGRSRDLLIARKKKAIQRRGRLWEITVERLPDIIEQAVDDLALDLHQVIASFSVREQALLWGLLRGETQSSLAEEMGVTPSAITRMKKRVFDVLRGRLSDYCGE